VFAIEVKGDSTTARTNAPPRKSAGQSPHDHHGGQSAHSPAAAIVSARRITQRRNQQDHNKSRQHPQCQERWPPVAAQHVAAHPGRRGRFHERNQHQPHSTVTVVNRALSNALVAHSQQKAQVNGQPTAATVNAAEATKCHTERNTLRGNSPGCAQTASANVGMPTVTARAPSCAWASPECHAHHCRTQIIASCRVCEPGTTAECLASPDDALPFSKGRRSAANDLHQDHIGHSASGLAAALHGDAELAPA